MHSPFRHRTPTYAESSAGRKEEQTFALVVLLWVMVAGVCVVAANAWAMTA